MKVFFCAIGAIGVIGPGYGPGVFEGRRFWNLGASSAPSAPMAPSQTRIMGVIGRVTGADDVASIEFGRSPLRRFMEKTA
jgi:hypothetical protein